MKVLVTGGAGFVGRNLVPILLASNHEVVVLDDLSSGSTSDAEPRVRTVTGDIRDRALLQEVVHGQDAIVHLAAQAGVPASLKDPERDCEINVLGTLRLLEAAREAAVRRFVFASSNAPLGRQPPPAEESKAPLPISPYGASKLAAEAYCLAYHGSWGLGTVVLRFANVYGPFSEHKSSVVARFFRDLMSTGRLRLEGDGSQTRDFIYVEDLCRAIERALESDVAGEVFQISTGVETSIRDLALLVQEIAGVKGVIEGAPPRQGDIQRNFASPDKARDLLGWEPQVGLRVGLRLTWTRMIRSEGSPQTPASNRDPDAQEDDASASAGPPDRSS